MSLRAKSLALVALLALAPATLRADGLADRFRDHVEFTVNGVGADVAQPFPLMLRVSPALLQGFEYSRAGESDGGTNFVFFLEGDATPLYYDVEKWDVSGESVFWVRLPNLPAAGATLTMYWALKDGETADGNNCDPAAVWSGYAGVWHMDGETDSASGAAGEMGETVATVAGLAGDALGATAQGGPFLTVEPGSAIEGLSASGFSASFWLRLDSEDVNGAFLFGRRSRNDDTKGYGVEFINDDDNGVTVPLNGFDANGVTNTSLLAMFSGHGATNNVHYVPGMATNGWMRLDFVFGEGRYQCWLDGILATEATGPDIPLPSNGNEAFAIGGAVGNMRRLAIDGAIDEFRLRPYDGSEDLAARFAAEYANVSQKDYPDGGFVTHGYVVREGKEHDSWLVEPSIEKTAWGAGELEAGELGFVPGVLQSGAPVKYSYVDLASATTNEIATLAVEATFRDLPMGDYELIAESTGTEYEIEPVVCVFSVKFPYISTFRDSVTITLNGIEDGLTITNYTLLLRLSPELLPGFSYSRAGHNGKRLAFSDENGDLLYYEVDTWNTGSESLVWVNVPEARKGARITLWWSEKEGMSAPEYKPENVWSDYAGVWHLNDENGVDATGNGGTGSLHERAKETDGVFGSAWGRTDYGTWGPTMTVAANDEINALTNGQFSVSAWIKLNDLATRWAYLFSRKEDDFTEGWGAQFAGGNGYGTSASIRVFSGAGDQTFNTSFTVNEWAHVVVAYGSESVEMFLNGNSLGSQSIASPRTADVDFYIGGMSADMSTSSLEQNKASTLNGYFDEVRLYKGTTTAAHVKAEIANAKFTDYRTATVEAGSFLVPGLVELAGVKQDFWISGPTLSSSIWTYGMAPANLQYQDGVLRSGAGVTNWCVCRNGEFGAEWSTNVSVEVLRNLPAGSYHIVNRSLALDEADVADSETDFTVIANSGVAAVGATAEGRILLMNNDFRNGGDANSPFIDSQSRDFDSGCGWVVSGEGEAIGNILSGNGLTLQTADGRRLWDLKNCRHGNTFPASNTTALQSNQNYLPYSSETSCGMTNGQMQVVGPADAGQLLMQNTTESVVYSQCYTNGIGTIYFDAVNGWNDNLIYEYDNVAHTNTTYQLVVEFATNTVEDLEPTDLNSMTVMVDPDDNTRFITNRYENLEGCWHELEIHPVRVYADGSGVALSNETASTTMTLAVTNGASTHEFYIAYVPVDIRGSVRFRIRRTGVKFGDIADSAYILLDNIIVSAPPMSAELGPAGRYDNSKTGSRVLGYEGAFSEPFPAVGDELYGRAVPSYYINSTTNLVETNFFASAKMHYRWRYLDLVDAWHTVELDTADGAFKTKDRLILPEGRVGDVEFWFESVLQAPYYSYMDYSGLGLADGLSELYTENPNLAVITNAANVALYGYPTRGTDWFVRLREHHSAYEGFQTIVTPAGGSVTNRFDMSLVGEGIWRGFVPTLEAVDGGLDYRFEGLNPQYGGVDCWEFATNFWRTADLRDTSVVLSAFIALTNEETSVAFTSNDWANVECDALTGHLMFQVDENTHSLTVTHADYQNVNKWHDAHSATNGLFHGSSTFNDSGKSGTSARTRDFSEGFETWKTTSSDKGKLWRESFEGISSTSGHGGYKLYQPFANVNTPNSWTTGPGMWVYSKYQTGSDMALQMKGNGEGFLQFTGGNGDAPYGIDEVSFKARLAQEISLDTMTWCDADGTRAKTNYTFYSWASLRDNPATDNYDGDATASVLAYYTPGVGCYEFRVTQVTRNEYQFSLCRWNKTGSAEGKETVLAKQTFRKLNDEPYLMQMGDDGQGHKLFGGLFISCETTETSTKIVAGVLRYRRVATGGTVGFETGTKWIGLVCEDSDSSKLTKGRYGVTSKNCPAVFWNPRHFDIPVQAPTTADNTEGGEAAVRRYYNSQTFAPGSGYDAESDAATIRDGLWNIDDNRFEPINEEGSQNWGLQARTIPQKVAIEWSPDGGKKWNGVVTNEVAGYTMSDSYTWQVYLKEDAAIRLKMVGSADDARADVTIDDVSFTQFRGDTMGSGRDAGDGFSDADYGFRYDFYFSSCWISSNDTEVVAKMSARRTLTNEVCAIRSPLMDGQGDRGIGLGMFSFEYSNAQTNTALILQIATNVVEGSATEYNRNRDRWEDFARFEFTPDTVDLAHGVRSCYIGLHDVQGMMRLIVDPALVEAVSSTRDSTAFGEIEIESVFCRDEPALDNTSWWGWNVRSVNSDGESIYDDGSRSLLQDFSSDPSATGLSLALNNSISEEVALVNGEPDPSLTQHMPFVQTPTFAAELVGEIAFKARRFDNLDFAKYAEVALYGVRAGDENYDQNWGDPVARFVVSNRYYETFTYQVPAGTGYRAFRLGVTGVPGVEAGSCGPDPLEGPPPVRVMVDEISVFEAVKPLMGFRYAYPFRTGLDLTTKNEGVVNAATCAPLPDEQPLAGESWTVQAEIYAKQLPDQLDLATPGHEPKVLFHWYMGERPVEEDWGWSQWRGKKSGSAELALATDADGRNMVFRGSIPLAPDAIVEEVDGKDGYHVAQYIAEVVYWTTKGEVLTNAIEKSEWIVPSWYSPVDYNATFAARGWSPFTILDTIAPDRVWINEVNVFDGKEGSNYPAETNQYIEVAVPQGQPIDGWRLDYIDYNIVTNLLCKFGRDGVASNKTLNETNGYVFVTVQNPNTRLSAEAGEVDGTWKRFDGNDCLLDETHPCALRLVRPSGVIEQEIAFVGTNRWAGTPREEAYSYETFLNKLLADGHTKVYYVGDEFPSTLYTSLGVTNSIGEVEEYWTNKMKQTPGRANVGQYVPENYVIKPNGSTIKVNSRIGAMGYGHIRQTFGSLVESLDDTFVMTLKGAEGTNIVYHIDQWWEIASLTTNGQQVVLENYDPMVHSVYTFRAAKGQSNEVSVVVTAQPRYDLRENYGLTADNRYTDAVMDWLANAQTRRGDFVNPGEIADAWFKSIYAESPANQSPHYLTLTERYWLDIDPSEPGWVLRAGIIDAPSPFAAGQGAVEELEPGYSNADDFKITVKMMITNELSNADTPNGGVAYAPYVLRGLEPGSQSGITPGTWTSVTFKVTGDIQNGKVNRERWVPLRRFTFGPGSFDENFRSVIEIRDPKSSLSGSTPGWKNYPDSPVFYRWSIDDTGSQDAPRVLSPTNLLHSITQ